MCLFKCVDANKFQLYLTATICPKAGAKSLPKNAKLPLPVYVFTSKKPFLKLPVNNCSPKGKCKAFSLTHRDL